MHFPPPPKTPTRSIGVSACILGHRTRYDGNLKAFPELTQVLASYFILVPVCPECEMGLPVPREPMQLEGSLLHPTLITRTSRIEHTAAMQQWIRQYLSQLPAHPLAGFVLKSKSPSCGLTNTPIHHADGSRTPTGSGLFAAALQSTFPTLPIANESTLQSPEALHTFIQSILQSPQ